MRVRIISEIQEFLDCKDKWDTIFNKHDYSFFQSFEFNYYSWINELSKNKLNRLYFGRISAGWHGGGRWGGDGGCMHSSTFCL